MRRINVIPALVGLFAVGVVGVVGVVGCGLPEDGPVQTVDPKKVPHGLVESHRSMPAAGRQPPVANGVRVFFTRQDHLVPVVLQPVPGGTQAQLTQALRALSAGPTAQEHAQGTGTAIPPGMSLVTTALVNGLATIDLQGDAAHPDVDQNAIAAGQIVLSATSVPGVRTVVLTRAGERVGAALPSGELATRSVQASDYAPLTQAETSGRTS